ncbi:MAG: prepilin-type N-terminal cleavage/methylation domain-containing protein [Burkholderiaceae bacterium]
MKPGGQQAPENRAARRVRGFTLIELLVVVVLVAIASAVVSLALRDPAATQLEHEAARLAALFEAARAEARASGLFVIWEPRADPAEVSGFRFVGLPAANELPTRWLGEGVSAEVIGARAVALGPEPLIGAQRVVLRLEARSLTLATDGLGPFVVADNLEAAH